MWPNDATTRVSSVEMLDTTLYAEASKRLTCPEMLGQLPGLEVAARRERRLATRTKLARLSCRRTLRQFNPGFQPSIDERQVWSWSSWPRPATYCRWGRPAWARPAWRGPGHPGSGYGAYSVRACDLMEDLRRVRAERNLHPHGCGSIRPPSCWWWTNSASGPTTGTLHYHRSLHPDLGPLRQP